MDFPDRRKSICKFGSKSYAGWGSTSQKRFLASCGYGEFRYNFSFRRNYFIKNQWFGKIADYLGGRFGSDLTRVRAGVLRCSEEKFPEKTLGVCYADISYGLCSAFISGGDLGKTVKLNAVLREPSRQIAIGDSDSDFRPMIRNSFTYRAGWRHQRRANFFFLDSHAESLRLSREELGSVKRWYPPSSWDAYKPSYYSPPSATDWLDYLAAYGGGN